MIHTVTLNPSLDYYIKNESIQLGKVNRVEKIGFYAGGKGFNVSKVLSNLNTNSKAYGILGGSIGRLYGTYIAKEKYEKEIIWLKNDETRVNVKLKSDKETDFNSSGPLIELKDLAYLVDKLRKSIKDNDIVILSGSIPKGLTDDAYKQIVSNIPKNIDLIVDTEGKALINTLKYHPLLIKPNYKELCQLYGKRINSIEEMIDAMMYLQRLGAKNVVTTLAEQGAVLLDQNQNVYHCQTKKFKTVNETGAGDSFIAGFVFSYQNTKDILTSFKIGIATGSAKAYLEGFPSSKEINVLLKMLKFEKIK